MITWVQKILNLEPFSLCTGLDWIRSLRLLVACFACPLATEGCMGEQASLEFDLTFGDVLLHKLVQAY